MNKTNENERPETVDEWAEREVASLKRAEAPKGISEEAIQEKVDAGLSRAQAIDVLRLQGETHGTDGTHGTHAKKTSKAKAKATTAAKKKAAPHKEESPEGAKPEDEK